MEGSSRNFGQKLVMFQKYISDLQSQVQVQHKYWKSPYHELKGSGQTGFINALAQLIIVTRRGKAWKDGVGSLPRNVLLMRLERHHPLYIRSARHNCN